MGGFVRSPARACIVPGFPLFPSIPSIHPSFRGGRSVASSHPHHRVGASAPSPAPALGRAGTVHRGSRARGRSTRPSRVAARFASPGGRGFGGGGEISPTPDPDSDSSPPRRGVSRPSGPGTTGLPGRLAVSVGGSSRPLARRPPLFPGGEVRLGRGSSRPPFFSPPLLLQGERSTSTPDAAASRLGPFTKTGRSTSCPLRTLAPFGVFREGVPLLLILIYLYCFAPLFIFSFFSLSLLFTHTPGTFSTTALFSFYLEFY